ncbi:NfeD family protein [Leptospira idonii]|uniref:NfeD family protein n=1 Tax=Leptospira idonii TaxID=1193500 RepID=A0A4R9LWY0_9LEPT|nr:NfeD family protein [Leptospira idonii]TGN18803.1 NfeD family protein [Leptospira idonii]
MNVFLEQTPYFWVIGGILLLALEFLIPGTFVMFLGIGAIITGITSRLFPMEITTQIILWMGTSLSSILLGGQIVKKLFRSESSVDPFVKDDFLGQIVPVEVDILVGQLGGKVKFQGTVWDAVSEKERIPKGTMVRILSRDNLTFTVETVSLD